MNAPFIGGLAQGLLGGYQFADEIRQRGLQSQRQQRIDQAALDQQGIENELNRERIGLEREKNDSYNQYLKDKLAQEGEQFGLAKRKFEEVEKPASQAQVGYENVRAEGLRASTQGQKIENNLNQIKVAQANLEVQRQEKLQNLQKLGPMLERVYGGGQLLPEEARQIPDLWNKTLSIPMESVLGNLDKVTNTFQQVREGKLQINSPESLEALNEFFGKSVQRGIGEMHTAPNGTQVKVERKEIAGLDEDPNNPGQFVALVRTFGKTKDGKDYAYTAPLTEFGTDDPNDQVVHFNQDYFENGLGNAHLLRHVMQSNPAVHDMLVAEMNRLKGPKDAKTEAEIGKLKSETEKNYAVAAEKIGLAGGKPVKLDQDKFTSAYDPAGYGIEDSEDYNARWATALALRDENPSWDENQIYMFALRGEEVPHPKTGEPSYHVKAKNNQGVERDYYIPKENASPSPQAAPQPKKTEPAPKPPSKGLIASAQAGEKAPQKTLNKADAVKFLTGLSGRKPDETDSVATRTKQVLDDYQRRQLLESIRQRGLATPGSR